MFRKRFHISNKMRSSEADRGVYAGLIISALLIGIGVITAGIFTSAMSLLGVLIVFGGTFGAACVQFEMEDLREAWHSFKGILKVRRYDAIERIEFLVGLGRSVRRNGLIVLDREAERTRDKYLRLALQLAVDGQPEHEIRRLLDLETQMSHKRASKAVDVFETMGNYAPAMGLIGTLIGLIQMLGSLSDPATVGPAMAVALTTTLYGAVLANLVFLPVAGKLQNYLTQQTALKAITVEGVISLAREENPVILQQRLQGFIPVARRAA